MIFQKHCKDKGIILIDILLAISLGVVFVTILFESSSLSKDIFEYAKEKEILIKKYESTYNKFLNLLPKQKLDIDQINTNAKWYGNYRVETEINIEDKLIFNTVKTYPFDKFTDKSPICSIDFYKNGSISIVPIFLPIDPLLQLSNLEIRNNTAYISIDSNRYSDPDFIIVNIASSSNPIILSSINTGPGIVDFSLVNDRVFAAAQSTVSQLHVIKFNSQKDIYFENKYKLPLISTTTVPTIASAVYYYKNLIFLGTEKWEGEEFNVLDISDPLQIKKVGGLEIGSKILDIFIWDDKAYLATAAENQFIVVDINDYKNPKILKTFSPSGWSRQEGKRVMAFEENINFGRTSGGFDIKNDYELFSGASTTDSSLDFSFSKNISGGVYGIVQDRFHVYIASREPNKEFQVFDKNIASTSLESYSLPIAPQILTCDNDKLYLLANSAPILYEISFK